MKVASNTHKSTFTDVYNEFYTNKQDLMHGNLKSNTPVNPGKDGYCNVSSQTHPNTTCFFP